VFVLRRRRRSEKLAAVIVGDGHDTAIDEIAELAIAYRCIPIEQHRKLVNEQRFLAQCG
jgi:hypothetical protein